MAVDRQMEIEELLNAINDILEQAKGVPFSEKVMVERNEIMEMTNEIRRRLPQELEHSRYVLEEKERILADAHKEADAIKAAAEEERNNMINEHEITKRAYEQAEEIVEASKKVARDMKIGAKEYADDLLQQVDEQMKRMGDFTSASIDSILKDYEANIKNFNTGLEQKRQILQQNRKELNVSRTAN
ncbi:MAG: ATPase [Firmicutes bacterium]|nr:ATPase [Bacillota bacterium]